MAKRFAVLSSVLLCSWVAAAAWAEPDLEGTPSELTAYLKSNVETIVIHATAEQTAHADLAHLTITVQTVAKTLSAALESNSTLRSRLVQDLLALGIASQRINNSEFSSSPQYGLFGRKPNQYEVANQLKVTAESELQLTGITKIADEYEQASIASIEFEHSSRDETIAAVSEEALRKANVKATRYAGVLNLKLTPVWFEAGERPAPMPGQHYIEEIVVTAKRRGTTAAIAAAPPTTFQELKYTARASVKYEVGQH